jgi:hypothetical protein
MKCGSSVAQNPSWESRVVTGMVQHPGADEPRRAY